MGVAGRRAGHRAQLRGNARPKQRKPATDEFAMMLDTGDALEVDPLTEGVANHGYVNSWMPKKEAAE